MKNMRKLAFLFTFISCGLQAQQFPNGFPFFLPHDDSTAQRFLPEFPAQPIAHFIGISPEGHFESDGERVRFWGVNTTFEANFPEKPDASFVAARMRKMGINLVRFHHMDNPWNWDDGSIFNQNFPSTRILNPLMLDRLHYFLARMKANGVYANLNLHVSRTFKTGDGVMGADSIADLGKAVTMFDERLIFLQKEYATQLLTSVNSYTGLAPADDPVVAMVEITNENTLYGYWKGDLLKHFSHGGNLMQRHCDTLDREWNQFLQNKYPSQAALQTAWSDGAANGGNEQLSDGGFELNDINAQWELELHEGGQATISADAANPFEGDFSGRVNVTNVTGTDWHIQFKQVGGSLEAGKTYTAKFAVRASISGNISFFIMRNDAPYTWYGGNWFWVTPDWQEHVFSFQAPENNNGQVRFGMSFLNQPGSFWFDNASLADPEVVGLEPGESLTNGTVRRFDYGERFNFTPQRQADMAEFYLALQRNYFNEMKAFLKDSLGVQVPITSSNAWSGISDLYTSQDMDFIDDHAYWDHPWFPNVAWSPTDWQISNEPMIKSQDWTAIQNVFSGLPMKGKPYTVSEYRHTFPNRYEVEMMPWMAAYLGFQDADGVMFFDYSGENNDWAADKITGFFSTHRNTVQMALSPIYGYAWRQGLIAPASEVLELEYSPEFIFQLPAEDDQGRWGKYLPYPARLGLAHAIRTSNFNAAATTDFSQLPDSPGSSFGTSNGETHLDFEKGLLTTAAPNFNSVCGFLNQPVQAGNLKITQGNDFGAVAWLSLDGQPLELSGESVLAIVSKVQNTGMTWDGTQTIHDDYGNAPTQNFPLELMLELALNADSLRLFPLSTTGAEAAFSTHYPTLPNRFVLNIDQSESKTLWFGVEVFGAEPLASEDLKGIGLFEITPNPAGQQFTLELQLKLPAALTVELQDMQGRTLKTLVNPAQPVSFVRESFGTEGLPSGGYWIKCRAGGKVFSKKLVVSK